MTNTDKPTDQERAEKVVSDLERFAADLGRYIAYLRDNPDIAGAINSTIPEVRSYACLPPEKHDVKAVIADFSRRARRAGAEMRKDVNDAYAGAVLTFGDVVLRVYSTREQVCERVVVGTREVEVEEPDPQEVERAIAALPKTRRVETVEDVEWRCTPLLAPDDEAEADEDEAVSA